MNASVCGMSSKKRFVNVILCASLCALLACPIFLRTVGVRKWPTIEKNITTPCKQEYKEPHVGTDVIKDVSQYLEETATARRRIVEICTKYKLNTPLIRRHFLYNSHDKSLYCWIRKVASTSFTKFFSDAMNRHIARNYYKEANVLAPRSLEQLKSLIDHDEIFKFVAVRHPFERLVSCYRDRIEDNTKYTDQGWIYARKIFRFTRPEIFRSNTTIDSLQKIYTTDKRLKLVPSFAEFAKWLVQVPTTRDDVHWDLYYRHCSVCNMTYNFVLKLDEHTSTRVNYVLSKIGTNKVEPPHLPYNGRSSGGVTDFETTCRYIGTLSRETVRKLYERYRIDFELYDYSLKKYEGCVGTRNRNAIGTLP